MEIIETALPGVLIIQPKVFGDSRGFFVETYHVEKYREAGIDLSFVQDNHSFSRVGTLRGLHAQYRRPQGKLVRALEGEVFDVAVDISPGSPTLGKWVGIHLSGENLKQLYIPPGYAHGFCVLSDSVHFEYKCTDIYDPTHELTVAWDDPTIGIDWPISEPLLSEKDRSGFTLQGAVDFLAELDQARWPRSVSE